MNISGNDTFSEITVAATNGTSGNDNLQGGVEPNLLDGKAGNDTLNGGLGRDILIGGSGSDTFTGTFAELNGDTITDLTDKDRVVFKNASFTREDIAIALPGLAPGATPFTLWSIDDGQGGRSNLTIEVFDALDFTVTPQGNDTVIRLVSESIATSSESIATSGNDRILGQGNDDTLSGLGGNDTITGKGGNDLLKGNSGRDVLYGNGGDDILRGNKGRDRLNGGLGRDTLTGGFGGDTFIGTFAQLNGDTITDLTDKDRVVFKNASFTREDIAIALPGLAPGATPFTLWSIDDGQGGRSNLTIEGFDALDFTVTPQGDNTIITLL